MGRSALENSTPITEVAGSLPALVGDEAAPQLDRHRRLPEYGFCLGSAVLVEAEEQELDGGIPAVGADERLGRLARSESLAVDVLPPLEPLARLPLLLSRCSGNHLAGPPKNVVDPAWRSVNGVAPPPSDHLRSKKLSIGVKE